MADKTKKPEILEEMTKDLQHAFDLFAESRLYMEKAAFIMRKVRLRLMTKAAYDAILEQEDGDIYFKTERLLSEIDSGCMLWRSYMVEIEKEQIKNSTKNPLIDFDLGPEFH